MDPESYQAAIATGYLAKASSRSFQANSPDCGPDIEEAEILAKKAVRIFKKLQSPTSDEVLCGMSILVNIKFFNNDYGDETKSLLEDYLSDAILDQSYNNENIAISTEFLGCFNVNIG